MKIGSSNLNIFKKMNRISSRISMKEDVFRLTSVFLLLFFAVLLILARGFFDGGRAGFVQGHPAPRTYLAISPMKYIDEEKTNLLRSRVESTISGVLVKDTEAINTMTSQLKSLEAGDFQGAMIPKDLIAILQEMPERRRQTTLKAVATIGFQFLIKENNGDEIATPAPEKLWGKIEELNFPAEMNNLIYQILEAVLRPAVKIDEELTQGLRNDLAASLKPI